MVVLSKQKHTCFLRKDRVLAVVLDRSGEYTAFMRGVVAPALSFLVAACGGDPAALRVVDLDAGRYALRDVPAGTLQSLTPLAGGSSRVLVDARITFEDRFPRDRGVDRARLVAGAREAHPHTTLDGDVAVARDLDSLGLLTGFAHVDRAVARFESIGVSFPAEVQVYYDPEFTDAFSLGLPTSDNAAYSPELDAFVLLPTEILEGIPLAMNPGVLIHELSHRLFYYRAFDARLFETLSRVNGQVGVRATFNRIRAVDEGVADFFAASFMNDPRYLDASVTGTSIGEERDLIPVRRFPNAWLSGLEPLNGDAYDPYGVGVLFASTLWAIAEDYGHEDTRTALLAALDAVAPALVNDFEFEFGDLMREVVAALPSDAASACDHVFERYGAAYPRVAPACS